MPPPSLIGLHDYVTATAIENVLQYYVFFAVAGLLLNLARFFHSNVLTLDRKDEEVQTLKAQVENLHNVLEEVIKILNSRRQTYNEEKVVEETEEVIEESEDEKEEEVEAVETKGE